MPTLPADPATGPAWRVQTSGDAAVLHLAGDWLARTIGLDDTLARRVAGQAGQARPLEIDATGIGRWDSGLVSFVYAMRAEAASHRLVLNETGLPDAVLRLLRLSGVGEATPAPDAPAERSALAALGQATIRVWDEMVAVAALLGATLLRAGPTMLGRARLRGTDVMALTRDAGAGALGIVAVVNLLVGGIMAFVGAVQLRRFGAEIFVANLVGVAVVREMGAIMTAIVMAGRTGGAYAAQIATMQGNEEIDALAALGIPAQDYLIMPRVAALTAMMPLLYLYGCAFGLLGGFLVAVGMLDLTPGTFVEQARSAVSGYDFAIGLGKSGAFGVLVALAGCRLGLKAGRSAADVGRAATAAVVAGIVGVIAIDAVFAVCANAAGV